MNLCEVELEVSQFCILGLGPSRAIQWYTVSKIINMETITKWISGVDVSWTSTTEQFTTYITLDGWVRVKREVYTAQFIRQKAGRPPDCTVSIRSALWEEPLSGQKCGIGENPSSFSWQSQLRAWLDLLLCHFSCSFVYPPIPLFSHFPSFYFYFLLPNSLWFILCALS